MLFECQRDDCARIIYSDAPRFWVYLQNLDRPFSLAFRQDTGFLFRRVGRFGRHMYLEDRAFVSKDSRNSM
jgi:hypothetical protein